MTIESFKEDINNSLKEIQENTGKQVEALKEETLKSLKELQENTNKQVKEQTTKRRRENLRCRRFLENIETTIKENAKCKKILTQNIQ